MTAFEDAMASSLRISVKLELRHRLQVLDPDSAVLFRLQMHHEPGAPRDQLLFFLKGSRGEDCSIPVRGFELPRGVTMLAFEGTAAGALDFFDLMWPTVSVRD